MKIRFFHVSIVLVAMPIVAIGVLTATNSFYEKQLPIFGTVPEFSLTERSGRAVSSNEFDRRVWVASFVFTRCSVQCPLIAARVQKIQKALRFKENLRLVSITVDPERDTAPVLAEYAKRYDADPYKWLFLTGDKKEINALVMNGFRLASDQEQGGDVVHSEKLVLVDAFKRIRGYYDANDEGAVRVLIKDAKRLLKETM